jgi:RHH-type transcriptional regulator, proline utilization regulon repressor / proline dehydrogenase / delta 1-pyrroline-5-carboxylate dehydrogenase
MPLQTQVEAFGQQLQSLASHQHPKTISWMEMLMAHTIDDDHFRTQALRFVDVLPALNDDQALAEHLQEYFADLDLPQFAEWGLKYTDTPWAARIAAPTVRYTLRGLARKFMGGSRLHHALTSISKLRHQSMNFTLDLLGEATISEVESEQYQQDYLQMIHSLSEPVSNWHQDELLDTSNHRTSPRLNVSLKLSSLYSQINPADPDDSIKHILKRLRPILKAARQNNAFVTFDMEQYDFKHIVFQCFQTVLLEDEFIDWPNVGIAIQAYLRESYDDLQQLINWSEQRGTSVTVRLVRGAYWDYETVISLQNDWPCPVWQNKCDTDANYERCLELLFNHHPQIETAVAGHNYRSIAYAMALAEHHKLKPDQFEFQMLYGMADHLKHALVKMGYRLRVYVPYGETLPGMAYLVRRLLENSSGQSILDFGLSEEKQDIDFSPPEFSSEKINLTPLNKQFQNTATLRFTHAKERSEFDSIIIKTRKQFGQQYSLIINGKKIAGDHNIESRNPANPEDIIGFVSVASHNQADAALESSLSAFPKWQSLPVRQRADYLRRVAKLLQSRRMQFACWQVFEAGKNWREADGDVCEAIDFINYYADQAEYLNEPVINEVSGEHNQYYHHAKGVGLVIPPWNFPLAILAGMLSATIVTGNTAILKPSSLTPVVAAQFMELFIEVGLPPGVINFLPGSGSQVGEYLARKAEINIIAFTGSQQVGTQLIQIGAQIQPGQHHVKQVIAEMGGKNTLIIDQDADLDDAILGTIQSAFGFQGQKCSAASRVIVDSHIHDRFIERLIEATRSITMGAPDYAYNIMGPVIDKAAYNRISQAIELGKKTASLELFEDNNVFETGYFIKPAIFTNVHPDSPLAQEEIFGPVLSVIKADDFEQALALANNTRYALTGGVYSRQPSHLQLARENFKVGNLYLNRRTTGALVSRQPFGGFKMSGQGSKAGGEDYLLQFMNTSCVTENTLRRGFAPKLLSKSHHQK